MNKLICPSFNFVYDYRGEAIMLDPTEQTYTPIGGAPRHLSIPEYEALGQVVKDLYLTKQAPFVVAGEDSKIISRFYCNDYELTIELTHSDGVKLVNLRYDTLHLPWDNYFANHDAYCETLIDALKELFRIHIRNEDDTRVALRTLGDHVDSIVVCMMTKTHADFTLTVNGWEKQYTLMKETYPDLSSAVGNLHKFIKERAL